MTLVYLSKIRFLYRFSNLFFSIFFQPYNPYLNPYIAPHLVRHHAPHGLPHGRHLSSKPQYEPHEAHHAAVAHAHDAKHHDYYRYDVGQIPECAYTNKHYYNLTFCLQDDYYPV